MPLEKLEHFEPWRGSPVKVTEMGWVTEIMYMSGQNAVPRIRKLDSDHYIVLDIHGNQVGDIKTFNHFENRASSANSLRQTFRRLRNTINANVLNIRNIRFLTLTYRQDNGEPMTDSGRLYSDFHSFHKRLKRYISRQFGMSYEYISVVEPQGSGAWHCHVLLFFNASAPFLENSVIADLWGHGFITIRSLRDKNGRDMDNIGSYLVAYLGDVDVDTAISQHMDITKFPCKEVELEEDGKKVKKYFLKGARLYFYPPGINIFRSSRGIKRPIESEDAFLDAKRKVSGCTLTFQSAHRIKTDDFEMTISKSYYNTKRKSSQGIIDGIRVDMATGEYLENLNSHGES